MERELPGHNCKSIKNIVDTLYVQMHNYTADQGPRDAKRSACVQWLSWSLHDFNVIRWIILCDDRSSAPVALLATPRHTHNNRVHTWMSECICVNFVWDKKKGLFFVHSKRQICHDATGYSSRTRYVILITTRDHAFCLTVPRTCTVLIIFVFVFGIPHTVPDTDRPAHCT